MNLHDFPDLSTIRPPAKAIQAISHEGVEPDVYDDLDREMRFALEMAKSVWCPAPSRKRLRAYAEKCARLLQSNRCSTSAKP